VFWRRVRKLRSTLRPSATRQHDVGARMRVERRGPRRRPGRRRRCGRRSTAKPSACSALRTNDAVFFRLLRPAHAHAPTLRKCHPNRQEPRLDERLIWLFSMPYTRILNVPGNHLWAADEATRQPAPAAPQTGRWANKFLCVFGSRRSIVREPRCVASVCTTVSLSGTSSCAIVGRAIGRTKQRRVESPDQRRFHPRPARWAPRR